MPIFYLEPQNGETIDPSWEASYLREGCWIEAESEAQACLRVENTTLKMRDMIPGRKVVFPPWQQPHLVGCREANPPRDIPPEKILTKSGKLIDVRGP
jgi:hypothetical protein